MNLQIEPEDKMVELVTYQEAVDVLRNLVGKGKLQIQKGPRGLFIQVYELRLRCNEQGHLHSRLFLTREDAIGNSSEYFSTIQLTDNTEPKKPNEWSIFPRLVILPNA